MLIPHPSRMTHCWWALHGWRYDHPEGGSSQFVHSYLGVAYFFGAKCIISHHCPEPWLFLLFSFENCAGSVGRVVWLCRLLYCRGACAGERADWKPWEMDLFFLRDLSCLSTGGMPLHHPALSADLPQGAGVAFRNDGETKPIVPFLHGFMLR